MAGDRLQGAGRWPGQGQDRPVHRAPRVVSNKNAVDEWYIAGTEPKDRVAPNTCGIDVVAAVHVETGFDAWMQGRPGLAATRGKGSGRRRRPEPHANRVLLQRRVPPVRLELGCARRRLVRRAESVADLLRRADPRPERRDPIVRHPDPERIRGGGRSPARRPARPRRRRWNRRSSRPRHRPSRHRPDADTDADTRRRSRSRRPTPEPTPEATPEPSTARPVVTEAAPDPASGDDRAVGRRGPRADGPARRSDHPRAAST